MACAFAAGIGLGSAVQIEPSALVLPILCFASLSVAASRTRLATLFICLAFLLAGSFLVTNHESSSLQSGLGKLIGTGEIESGDPVVFEGVLDSAPELSPGRRSFIVAVRSVSHNGSKLVAGGRVMVFVSLNDAPAVREFSELELAIGSRVRFGAILTREDPFNNPGGYSFEGQLNRQGLDAVASAKGPLLIEAVSPAPFTVSGYIGRMRNRFIRAALKDLPQPMAGIFIASVLGNRNFLDRDSAEGFRTGGTFHLLVVSGLHVSVVGSLFLIMLSAAGFGVRSAAIVASAGVWCFAILAGGGAPVIRSCLMFTFLVTAHSFHRKAELLNALGAAALVILIIDPRALFDPSFQLTVTAVASLAGAAFPILGKLRDIGGWSLSAASPFPPGSHPLLKSACEIIYWEPNGWRIKVEGVVWDCGLYKSAFSERIGGKPAQKLIRTFFEAAVVSLVLQICLLPFQVVYFHRFSPSAVLLNLPAGVALLVNVLLSITAVILASISESIAGPFAETAWIVGEVWSMIQQAVTNALGGSWRLPVYSGALKSVYFIYGLILVVVVIGLNQWDPCRPAAREVRGPAMRKVVAVTILTGLLLVIVLHPFSAPPADGRLTAYFLDVGQGDSTFLTFPDGSTMLVDGGGRMSFGAGEPEELMTGRDFERDSRGIGDAVVSEFLWEQGRDSIDFAVVTHGDADHLNGMIEVVRNFRIGRILIGRYEADNPEFLKLMDEAARKRIPVEIVSEGIEALIGGAALQVLNSDEGTRTQNDASVVLRISFKRRTFLLTGDIEQDTERRLVEAGNLRADVVKVPHHGSRTSSTRSFVDSVGAEYAVIPVGQRSRFGHPHPEVVERWKEGGARVYTTGTSGTVTVSTDGSVLEVKEYLEH